MGIIHGFSKIPLLDVIFKDLGEGMTPFTTSLRTNRVLF